MSGVHLAGRVAVVTGAGKGLGRAYALELARGGAAVVVNNRRHPGESDAETSAARVVAEIVAAGGRAVADHSPVEAADSGERMVAAALDHFGRLDIVVANAAAPQAASLHKLSPADFRTIFDVGFYGTLHLVQAAWPLLRDQGYGRVVMTSSSAGRYGQHGLSAYGAAKGAVDSLVRTLASEGAGRDIKVNAVSPYAASQMTAAHMRDDVARRFTPERVAPLVAWLASEGCSVSGRVIVAGGGRFRLTETVETDSLPADGDFADLLARLERQPRRTHPHSNHAFDTLLVECGLAPRAPLSE
ncbi:3-oxoacyl-ACP reductase [Sphingobium jiangsuense]|uniref:NAD(P)-dependent dehydrogenase (Short-subunit alcohol dehydrogenase family) n=1 Tax=Sphingobium jiangsuense TaxID=870476 RepID=A0A7W6BRC2_9SPHN|nr:SDR family NAD(P)-dependent oxidoreductase [Sphingobium jiangsuense]MBB3928387.1 NAD(P)-dependent dehydrogenase (short-subunit alcohol dehydrogenase family) [Sphingobium jiangsuense]GLS99767.1 3-oxoacyl-ACP reductase [Sphingobium jiangsuense]